MYKIIEALLRKRWVYLIFSDGSTTSYSNKIQVFLNKTIYHE